MRPFFLKSELTKHCGFATDLPPTCRTNRHSVVPFVWGESFGDPLLFERAYLEATRKKEKVHQSSILRLTHMSIEVGWWTGVWGR
jgi:hypothetical protein